MRAFVNIAEAWGLSVAEQLKLLGIASRSTFFKWRRERDPRLPRRHSRTSLLSARHLQVAADPAPGSQGGRRLDSPTQCRRTFWWPIGARTHVVRQGGRSLRGAGIPRRRAWIRVADASGETKDGGNHKHRKGGEVRAVPSHRREPAADDPSVRAGRGSGRLGRALRARVQNQSSHPHPTRRVHLVPVADRVSGPNASIVMAPFTHLSPPGTRFTDGHFGAYYAAESVDTAIAETRFHRENFLRATSQPAIELEMRCYLADVACESA